MAAPSLAVEQYQFTDNGILLNSDPTLPFVDITGVQGLDNAPTRTSTKDHEGTDGGWVDSKYETLRTVVIDAIAYAVPTALDAFLDQLAANFAPTDSAQPFYWMSDNGPRVVYGKSQGLKWNKSNSRGWGTQTIQFTLICGDPRKYGTSVVSSNPIYLGSAATGGRGYNKSYTFGYGAAATQSAGSITPGGNRETPGLYVITGPIINPGIVNDTLGLAWTFQTSLNATETLNIDPRVRTVRFGSGGPSRRNAMRGPWWLLLSGQNNFRLLGSGGTAGVTNLTITAQPAWR
jgi:hypothetical protein